MLPFCNFQDTVSTKILYTLFLQKDSDGDVLEFITNDMLNMGGIFEDEDEPESSPPLSSQKQLPLQPIQISAGFLYCSQPLLVQEKEQPGTPRVFGFFIDSKYEMDFYSAIFHPPSFIA